MIKLIIASNNEHKVKEIKEILNNLPLRIMSLKDAGINIDVDEDGSTFKENAYKKAKEIKDYLIKNNKDNFIVIADDSGLEIDYLNGEPGVYSARYSGEHGNSVKNNDKVLKKLLGVPREKRTARFVCSIVILTSKDEVIVEEGSVNGRITEELSGVEGFGYDPIFYIDDIRKTFAEMSEKEKNAISHRGKALELLRARLETII